MLYRGGHEVSSQAEDKIEGVIVVWSLIVWGVPYLSCSAGGRLFVAFSALRCFYLSSTIPCSLSVSESNTTQG